MKKIQELYETFSFDNPGFADHFIQAYSVITQHFLENVIGLFEKIRNEEELVVKIENEIEKVLKQYRILNLGYTLMKPQIFHLILQVRSCLPNVTKRNTGGEMSNLIKALNEFEFDLDLHQIEKFYGSDIAIKIKKNVNSNFEKIKEKINDDKDFDISLIDKLKKNSLTFMERLGVSDTEDLELIIDFYDRLLLIIDYDS